MDGLRTVIFDVADLPSARSFYAKVLQKQPYFDQPFYVGFDVAGYELGLRPLEGDRRAGAGGATAYFGVQNVDEEVARLVGLGATVREDPVDVGSGIRVAAVLDPFGGSLGLIRNPEFAPPLAACAPGDLSPREIRLERTVGAPRGVVWELWTTAAGISKWLVSDARIDLRVGGHYELYFLADYPAGSRGSETCRVLSFLPGRMISFTWNAPPHLERTRWLHTWVVVELEDAPDGTRVRVTHTGWPMSGLRDEPQWERTFAYFERAWAAVLDSLDHYARTGQRME